MCLCVVQLFAGLLPVTKSARRLLGEDKSHV